MKLSKKSKIILILVWVLVFLGSIVGYLYLKWTKAQIQMSKQEEKISEFEGILKYICPLDGQLTFNQSKTQSIPLAIAVENHLNSRPQSGLDKAEIVYEALVEGGITRFLAFYLCQEAGEIGPVRSARAYFLDWLSEYNAAYAHVGGSPEAMRLISTYGILDLDQFYNAPYYQRVFWRFAPHNVYTSTSNLQKAVQDKGFKAKSFSSFNFKDEPLLLYGNKTTLQINYNHPQYVVKYVYDRKSNRYLRYQGGLPFKDKVSGQQIAPKNVVVMWVGTQIRDYYGRLALDTTGLGKALFFQDGKVISGSWAKKSPTDRIKFYDENKKEIAFNRGPIWIQVVPLDIQVSY